MTGGVPGRHGLLGRGWEGDVRQMYTGGRGRDDRGGKYILYCSDSADAPVGEGQYNVWKRYRNHKKGGSVMVLTRKDVINGKVKK